MVLSCVVLTAAPMPDEQAYCTRMLLVYTVRQVPSACRTVSEHFTYFPCKYVKSHFSDRVNGFFTEVERMTKDIVTREIRDKKIRELARVYLSRAVTTRWMPGALAPARSSCRRCSSNSASTCHLTFAITNSLIPDVGTAGRDTPHPDVAYPQMGDFVHQSDVAIPENVRTTLSLMSFVSSLEVFIFASRLHQAVAKRGSSFFSNGWIFSFGRSFLVF